MTFEENKNYSLKCASLEIFKAMHQFAVDKTGIRPYKDVDHYTAYDYKEYPNLNITRERIAADCRTGWGNTGSRTTVLLSTEEFTEYCENYKASVPVTIKLNGSYDAIINLDKQIVQVGCQNIPFSKVKELANLIP